MQSDIVFILITIDLIFYFCITIRTTTEKIKMRKILYTLAFALSMIGTAQAENKPAMNCDSTCLGGPISTMTAQQAKAQTAYATNTSQ